MAKGKKKLKKKCSRSTPAPLTCAPCWICLEDGPDEAEGDPLVRVCACRGEAAGYHISCIIRYARSKTVDPILSSPAGGPNQKVPGRLDTPWKQCPNCHQPYVGDCTLRLGRAFVDSTSDLPDNHLLRFKARSFWASTLWVNSDATGSIKEFKRLLDVLDRSDEGMLLYVPSTRQDQIEAALHQQIVVLLDLALVYEKTYKYANCLEVAQRALDRIAATNPSELNLPFDDALMKKLNRLAKKCQAELGLIPKGEIGEIQLQWARKDLEESIESGNETDIYHKKLQVIFHLATLKRFPESLKLAKETVEHSRRVLGPNHKETKEAEGLLNLLKAQYREYLKGT